MSDDRIDVARLRQQIGTHPHSWPRAELLALVEAVEAAQAFVDGGPSEWPRLVEALSRFSVAGDGQP